MQTITFSAIKGGVGKSSLAILTANCLASTGKRVLVVDADPQNSTTFFYLPDMQTMEGNLAKVLYGQTVEKNIIPAMEGKISVIPSALELITCKELPLDTLMVAMERVNSKFDFCIIDTAPNFDNVTLNCLVAADLVITPVQFSNFDYKSAVFYRNLLNDIGILDNWRLLFNRFKALKSGGSIAAEYLALYNNTFSNQVLKTRVPESVAIKQYFDTGSRITKAKTKIKVFNAIAGLAKEVVGANIKVESF